MGPVKASHGFARTSQWAVVQETSTASSVTLRLPGTTEQAADLRKDWPHAFELRLTIKLEVTRAVSPS